VPSECRKSSPAIDEEDFPAISGTNQGLLLTRPHREINLVGIPHVVANQTAQNHRDALVIRGFPTNCSFG